MGPEIMEVVEGQREREFVRLVYSRSLDLRMKSMEQAQTSQDWDDVDVMLRDWIVEAEEKSTAIHYAIKYGRPHLVLDNYPRIKGEIDIGTLISLFTLHSAAKRGYYEFVSLILEECRRKEPGKLAELINGHDPVHWTALHWACQNGHPRVAEVILKANVHIPLEVPPTTDASSEDTKFTTPLHLAIKPSDLVKNDSPLVSMAKSDPIWRVSLVDLLLKTPEGSELLNMKDWQGSTPLHLAVETMSVAVVELLIKEPRLIATERNNRGKTPSALMWDQTHSDLTKNSASVKIIQKYLGFLQDVRKEHEALFDTRARYHNAANNLLVGGALIAQVTFSGILSMVDLPQEFSTGTSSQAPSLSLAPSSTESTRDQTPAVENLMDYRIYYVRAIDAFRGSNNLSFYFAIITVTAAIRLMISRGQNIPLESEVSRVRNSTILTSLSLTFSTVFAVVAFISGGLANIPATESGWSRVLTQWASGSSPGAIFKSTMLTTTMVGLMLVFPFILIPLLHDYLDILRAYLDAKLDYWDHHYSKWALRPWRQLVTLVLAGFFLVATIFSMFMLIFGLGLLEENGDNG